jgi:hypothetical protein
MAKSATRISGNIERFSLISNALVLFSCSKGESTMRQANVTLDRLAWRLNELAKASGLSVPFLRKEAYCGRLKTRKVGNAVIVLDEDARSFLKGEGNESQPEQATAGAVAA